MTFAAVIGLVGGPLLVATPTYASPWGQQMLLTGDGAVFEQPDTDTGYSWTETQWTSNDDNQIHAIADSGGYQMVIDNSGVVWATTDNPSEIGGWADNCFPSGHTYTAIATDGSVIRAVDSSGDLWANDGPGSGPSCSNSAVEEVSNGTVKTIVMAYGSGTNMYLDTSGNVWARTGDTIATGDSWVEETSAGNTNAIATGDSGFQMELDAGGDIWAKDTAGSGGWTEESSAENTVSIAAGGGTQMEIDSAHDLWAKSDTSISSSGWTEENSSGNTSAIAAGDSGFQMETDPDGSIFTRDDIGTSGWNETWNNDVDYTSGRAAVAIAAD
jgi:hypothetical protein